MEPTGIDTEKLLLQVARLEETLRDIETVSKKKRNPITKPALERLLQIAIEEVLNIGNHIISGLGLTRAETYKDIFTILEKEKLIPPVLASELKVFATFRNRLVHLYWKIEEEEFEKQLQKCKFLATFVKVILQKVKQL